jgi:hypothetical protein
MTRGALVTMCMAGWIASAQSPGAPQFEVATVKVAHELRDGAISIGMRVDHGEITWAGATLGDFIRYACNVKDYQVSGPDWLKTDRFDLAAKAEGDASQDQIRVMLRALLSERFAMALHTASKNMPVYALIVAKGGLKIPEVKADGWNALYPEAVGDFGEATSHEWARRPPFAAGGPARDRPDWAGRSLRYRVELVPRYERAHRCFWLPPFSRRFKRSLG